MVFLNPRPQTRNFRGSTCTRSKTHTTFCRAPNVCLLIMFMFMFIPSNFFLVFFWFQTYKLSRQNNELSLRLPLRVQLPAATGIWIAGPPWLALPPPRSWGRRGLAAPLSGLRAGRSARGSQKSQRLSWTGGKGTPAGPTPLKNLWETERVRFKKMIREFFFLL